MKKFKIEERCGPLLIIFVLVLIWYKENMG